MVVIVCIKIVIRKAVWNFKHEDYNYRLTVRFTQHVLGTPWSLTAQITSHTVFTPRTGTDSKNTHRKNGLSQEKRVNQMRH